MRTGIERDDDEWLLNHPINRVASDVAMLSWLYKEVYRQNAYSGQDLDN